MRLATAACMQKYGNVSFVTVACAKCMRYGGGWGTIPLGGGGWDPGSGLIYTEPFSQNGTEVMYFTGTTGHDKTSPLLTGSEKHPHQLGTFWLVVYGCFQK